LTREERRGQRAVARQARSAHAQAETNRRGGARPGTGRSSPIMMKVTAADIGLARTVLETEAAAILALVDRLDERFELAVRLLLDCRGRVIVTGMGKSGIICRKIAATLSSTGTPALFLHPA